VKNADGEDSPATARRDLSAQVRGWLAAAGAHLPDEGIPVEVNHAQVDSAEDARALGAAALGPAGDAVCHGTDATL
jgi:hypothetical protein